MKAYEDADATGSPFLAGAEAGTVALTAGNWGASIQHLSNAAAVVQDADRAALISPESLGEVVLSWVLNDTVKQYRGEGYERVLLHSQLALAYLAHGDFSSAHVEVRQSNALLESEERLYEKEYRAGGLGHFLSAIVYEIDRKPDEAYIDYKRMAEKGVGTEVAAPALVRLAKRLDFTDDLAMWEERFDVQSNDDPRLASVVVIAGIGLGPYKKESSLTIPTGDGIIRWAVPAYKSRPQPIGSVVIRAVEQAQRVRTATIEDVGHVARENLEDKLLWLAAKSAVRTFLKRELTQQLSESVGFPGELAGDVFNFISERADLRCWATLPDTWQAARLFLPAGRHELEVEAGPTTQSLGAFDLEEGETMFILVRTLGSDVYAHAIGGGRQAVPAEAPVVAE